MGTGRQTSPPSQVWKGAWCGPASREAPQRRAPRWHHVLATATASPAGRAAPWAVTRESQLGPRSPEARGSRVPGPVLQSAGAGAVGRGAQSPGRLGLSTCKNGQRAVRGGAAAGPKCRVSPGRSVTDGSSRPRGRARGNADVGSVDSADSGAVSLGAGRREHGTA